MTKQTQNQEPTTPESKVTTVRLGNKVITLRLRDEDSEDADSYGESEPIERPWMLSGPGKNNIHSRNIKRAKSPFWFIISKIGELFSKK